MSKRSSVWLGEAEWGRARPPKWHRKPENPLMTLPDDILVHISSLVAASDWHNKSFILRPVCKAFNLLGKEPYVLRALSESVVRNLYWLRNTKKCDTFEKCLDSGNPEAMYFQGVYEYFNRDDQTSGIRYLKASANAGIEKATYAHGMILFCLGGEDKAKGFDMLCSLTGPTVYRSMMEMFLHRTDTATSMWTNNSKAIDEMRRSYVRETCGCNGQTTAFMEMDMWEWEQTGMEINSTEACHICFFDREVRLLLGADEDD